MAFKRYTVGTKGPNVCQEKIPHTIIPTPPAWTVETRQDGSILLCSLCQIPTLPSESRSRNQDSSDQATFFQSSILQFWRACANCSLCFLFVAHPVSSSTAVAHLFQGLTCCAFRYGIPHTLVVMCDYLSYCSLSTISNQSAHSPLTSTRHFLFFGPFSVNPRDVYSWISQ